MPATTTRSRFSHKTLAIALAAGVSLGGVQIAGPKLGLNTTTEASAATLDPSVVTTTKLVSDKSGKNVFGTTVKATEEAYAKFYETHGHEFKLKLDFVIPDDAQPGDSFTIIPQNNRVGSFDISGTIPAHTANGVVVGNITVSDDNKPIKFTVSDQIADAISRKASFEIPMTISRELMQHTYDKAKKNTGDTYSLSFSHDPNAKLNFNVLYDYTPFGIVTQHRDAAVINEFSPVNVNRGTARIWPQAEVGYANTVLVEENDPETQQDNVYALNPDAKTNRDITIRYTVDDPEGRIVLTGKDPKQNVWTFSPVGLSSDGGPWVNSESAYFYAPVSDKTHNVTYKQINDQTIEATIRNVKPGHAINLDNAFAIESPYVPNKKVTVTGTFVNGVGKPHSAYDDNYYETTTATYTHPAFEGYGSANDIKRNVAMSAKVNGQEADNVNSAEQIKDGKAKFSIDLKNNGNIGAGSATVKYPKGVTGPNGETEKFIDFGKDGFPVGSTKTLDLGELNVPEGANENTFTVIMTGYPALTDAAWTATGPTDIYVDKVERKGDTVTITRNDGENLTFKVNDTNGIKDVIDNGDGSITIVRDNGAKKKVDLTHATVTETNKDKKNHTITITTPDGKTTSFNAYDNYVTAIKPLGDGKYALVRKDSTQVEGVINTTDGSVTNVKSDGKGNLLVTIDGEDKKVPLDQVKVIEANKGTKDHTITITVPGEKPFTFNAYDTYVTDIKKNDKGDYDVYRSDVKGVWKTITFDELRKEIANLKGKDAEQDKRLDGLDKKLNDANNDLDALADKVAKNESAIENHRKTISDILINIGDIENEIGDIENELIRLDGQDIAEIHDNGDGTYTLIRHNNDEVTGVIDTSGNIITIEPNGKGGIVVTTVDGTTTTVPLDQVKVTESNKGTPNHTVTITTPNGDTVTFNAFDTYVTDIKKNADGDYDIYRSDKNGGKTVWKTIDLSSLRKAITDLKDKDAEQDERLDGLDKQLKNTGDELDDLAEKVAKNEGAIEDHRKTIGDILVTIGNIEGDIEDIEDELTRLDGQDIKEVRDNGDGTYTLIRNNGDEVKVNIGSSETVTGITPNKDGSITVHKIDGSEVKVDLAKVTITEKNKGTPKHTITITVPGEKPFTFNAYDNYIVDVKREDNGNYTVVRRDKTTWEINLKDIRDRITALEDKDSPTRDEFDKVKKDLADLNARVNKEFKAIDNRFENVEGDITNLRNDLTALENRVTKVEARLDLVEDRTDALTKCLYGSGMAAIPAALSIPLAMLTQVQIPGVTQLNTDIQRQIGIYDENLAKMWGEYGGVLQAGAALSVLAGMIGGLAYLTNECAPLTATDAAQETDLGQLSSKMEQGSSRKDNAAAPKADAEKDDAAA